MLSSDRVHLVGPANSAWTQHYLSRPSLHGKHAYAGAGKLISPVPKGFDRRLLWKRDVHVVSEHQVLTGLPNGLGESAQLKFYGDNSVTHARPRGDSSDPLSGRDGDKAVTHKLGDLCSQSLRAADSLEPRRNGRQANAASRRDRFEYRHA